MTMPISREIETGHKPNHKVALIFLIVVLINVDSLVKLDMMFIFAEMIYGNRIAFPFL